ncbi:hypothetical protein ILYODFUR_025585 [Ilyodon furcidens]|uniref:Uncharacterized protein n=1 Tax=Ilyodon furcidens TaxID=33524 RepID=A0ABV0UJC5_9TELE
MQQLESDTQIGDNLFRAHRLILESVQIISRLCLESSDSSVAFFSVRSCSLVFCKEDLFWHRFYSADSLTGQPLLSSSSIIAQFVVAQYLILVVTVAFFCHALAFKILAVNTQLAPVTPCQHTALSLICSTLHFTQYRLFNGLKKR